MTEKVLVVEAAELGELAIREGLLALPLDRIKTVVESHGKYIDRELAERDDSIRQIIPYVVLRSNKTYLLMARTKKQKEARLHNKYSIGVGGHINPEDGCDPWSAFLNGMKREINEEIKVELASLEYLGVLNDLATPVSRVHTGVVYIAEGTFYGFEEEDKFLGSMVELETLAKHKEKMETWAQIVLKKLESF